MTDRDDLRALEDDLFAIEHPGVAAVRPRDAWQEASRSRYRAAVCAALADGWTLRQLARRADCTVQHLAECFHLRRNASDWMFEALPKPGQVVAVKQRLRSLKGDGGRNVA